jgi:undecaprenyl phosphate-alpha-L-ara4N flippase subunit ArnE
MTPARLALLLFAVSAAASGQLMLKHGMALAAARAGETGGSLVLRAATSPWVVGGLAVFAVSAVAWLATLARVPLSIAYPFNALGFLAILVSSVVVLGERVSAWTWAGSLLVVTGLLVVVVSAP